MPTQLTGHIIQNESIARSDVNPDDIAILSPAAEQTGFLNLDAAMPYQGGMGAATGGFRLGAFPETSADGFLHLSKRDSSAYQNLAVGRLKASGLEVLDADRNLLNIGGVGTSLNPTTANSRSLGTSAGNQWKELWAQSVFINGSAAVATTDARLSDARTPLGHAATHLGGGSDPISWGTVIGSGTLAARPAAATANTGYLYWASDDDGGTLYRSNGTAWVQWTRGATEAPVSHTHDHGALTGLGDDDHGQYHTDGRALTWLGGRSTSDLPEGTNLYHTNARADARIAAQKGVADGLATLGGDGKVPTSQLPALALSETFVVASQAAMLALTAQRGDVAVRTDLNKTFILKTDDPSQLANWQELLTPADAVTSVNGQTGVVVLTTAHVAEGSNLYYLDERVDDRVANLVRNGTGISWAYDDALGQLTPTVSLSAFNTGHLAEGSNLYHTTERAQDAVGSILTDSASVDFTYDDAAGTISASVIPGGVNHNALLGLQGGAAGDYQHLTTAQVAGLHSRQHGLTSASDHAAAAGSDKGKWLQAHPTTGAIQFAAVGYADLTGVPGTFSPSAHAATHLAGGSDGIAWTQIHDAGLIASRPAGAAGNAGYLWFSTDEGILYRSGGAGGWTALTNALTHTHDHGSLTGLGDDDHPNYYNLSRLDSWLAGKTTANLAEGSNLYHTTERAQDAVGSALTDTASIDFTYDDAAGTISATVIPGGINGSLDHGALLGLSDDDHAQYALLAGRAGGQTLIGGTAASQNLTLQSTANATRGSVIVADAMTLQTMATGATNSVLTEAGGVVQKRTIDARAWGASLVDGSGSAGRVPYWTDGDSISSDAGLLWDATAKELKVVNEDGAGFVLQKSGDAGRNFLRWRQGAGYWQAGFRGGPYSWVLEYQTSATAPNDDTGWTQALAATTAGYVTVGARLGVGTAPSYPLDAAGDGRLTGMLYFGSGTPDVNLYRGGANLLRTDDTFECANLRTGGVTINGVLVGGAYAEAEFIGDGTETTFVLDHAPIVVDGAASPKVRKWGVFYNGVRMREDDDFTVEADGKTLEFAFIPEAGKRIVVPYEYNPGG